MKKRKPEGFDLVNVIPDYRLTAEEDRERLRREHYKVYGEYPPDPKEPREKPESTN